MKISLCAAVLAILGLGSVSAQEGGHVLDQVVVTATGQTSPVRDVQASVEVIEAEKLRLHGDDNIAQALKQAVGVQASNGGATGDIAIRGFNRNHTLVLVDGFRRTNNYGSNNPTQIAIHDVERIEIVRGPLSSLYGSDALGGVVNVITRHPGRNPGTDITATTGAARDGRESLRIGVSTRLGDEHLGHALNVEQNFRNRLRHAGAAEDDLGRLNNWSGSYRGRLQPGSGQRISWAFEAFDRDGDGDAIDIQRQPYSRFEDERRYFASVDYRQAVGDGEIVARGSVGQSKGETNRSHPVIETTDYRQFQGDLIHHLFPHPDHAFSLGIGALRDELDVSINSREASRNNAFALVQDQWQIAPSWQLVGGLRVDNFDDFGSTTNPRVSLGWTHGAWSGRLGYGSAFRAPSLLEQYASFARGRLLIRGNAALDPEKSTTWEAMLRREFGAGLVEITLHRNRIRDLIDSFTTDQMLGALRVVEYRNISRAAIDGVELVSRWQLADGLELSGGVDLTDARNADTDARLTGRARQTWRLETAYTRGAWAWNLRARHMRDYLSVRIDAPRDALPVDSNLTRVDLGVQYHHDPRVTLFGGVDNIFDRRDPDNFAVTATGTQRNDPDARYAYVGVRVAF